MAHVQTRANVPRSAHPRDRLNIHPDEKGRLGSVLDLSNDDSGEPEHQHFDFRFLFRTSADTGEL